jgi:hypothetical protein
MAFSKVAARRGNIESAGKLAIVIVNRRIDAGEADVARMEMLVTVDGDGAPFGQAGADAVGAFSGLAPHRAGPKTPVPECLVVGGRATTIDSYAMPIRQQHAAARTTDGVIEPIKRALRRHEQWSHRFARFDEARLGDGKRLPGVIRRKTMHGQRPFPRRGEGGARRG